MLIEIENVNLAARIQYAMSAQFVDRLEENGKLNATEKLRLKDILEDKDGKPKGGDTTEQMKKELKRLKIVDNREEPFAKETITNYVRNEDNRISFDGNPKFFRTASKG